MSAPRPTPWDAINRVPTPFHIPYFEAHGAIPRGRLDVQTKRSMVQLPGFEQTRTIYEEQLRNDINEEQLWSMLY